MRTPANPPSSDPNLAWTATSIQKDKWIARGWTQPGKTYDPDAFYTQSTDQHHNFASITLRVPRYLLDICTEIASEWPNLATSHDFIRNAAFHAVHHFASNSVDISPETRRRIDTETSIATSRRKMMDMEAFDTDIEEAINLANAFWAKGDDDGLHDQEQDYARKLYVDIMDDPFGNGTDDTIRESLTSGEVTALAWLVDGIRALRDNLEDKDGGIKKLHPLPTVYSEDVIPIQQPTKRKKAQ